MDHSQNNKRAYLVLGIMFVVPVIMSLVIAAQLYATMMRFS